MEEGRFRWKVGWQLGISSRGSKPVFRRKRWEGCYVRACSMWTRETDLGSDKQNYNDNDSDKDNEKDIGKYNYKDNDKYTVSLLLYSLLYGWKPYSYTSLYTNGK